MSETDEKIVEILARLDRLEKMMTRLINTWAAIRASTIQYLGNVEDFLGYQRSIEPRHKRERT